MTSKDFRELKAFIDARREVDTPYDLVSMGYLLDQPVEKHTRTLDALAAAGLTWWLESFFHYKHDFDKLLTRIEGGPPL
jgi:hypothetical protein